MILNSFHLDVLNLIELSLQHGLFLTRRSRGHGCCQSIPSPFSLLVRSDLMRFLAGSCACRDEFSILANDEDTESNLLTPPTEPRASGTRPSSSSSLLLPLSSYTLPGSPIPGTPIPGTGWGFCSREPRKFIKCAKPSWCKQLAFFLAKSSSGSSGNEDWSAFPAPNMQQEDIEVSRVITAATASSMPHVSFQQNFAWA